MTQAVVEASDWYAERLVQAVLAAYAVLGEALPYDALLEAAARHDIRAIVMLAPTEAQVTEAFAPVVALLAQTLRKGGRLGHDALPEVDLTDEEQQALLY